MTPSNEKKKEIAQLIISSKTFQNAPTSSALLNYLVEAHCEGKFLKEGIIDIEFFGAKAEAEKNNPRVRVNMYNLRKKLSAYYEGEGADADWHLMIDKGQYGIRFEKQQNNKSRIPKITLRSASPYIIILALVIVLATQNHEPAKPPIWKNLLSNGKPTTLFVGDAYGFKGQTITGRQGWSRDFEINSAEEYYSYLDEHPELKEMIFPANYYYVTDMAVQSTQDLTRMFTQYGKEFKIRNVTSTTFTDIKGNNCIYVGMVRNGNKFVSAFNDANPNFNLSVKKLNVFGLEHVADTAFRIWTTGEESDYAIVSHTQSPQGTEQFFFFASHDMGVSATVEYFTNTDSLKAFSEQYLGDYKNFTAVYKAVGHERTSMDLKTILIAPF